MKRICVIGAGYVGLVVAGCFANLGHRVTCVEADQSKIDAIEAKRLPISEPGLSELWERSQSRNRLRTTGDYEAGLRDCEFVFIAVGTPGNHDGSVDLQQLFEATRGVARVLRRNGTNPPVVVIKSTVPVGTAEAVLHLLEQDSGIDHSPAVVSNPEFLQEGKAVADFMEPARVVVGSGDKSAARAVAALYEPLGRPIILCDNRTAEMIKYVSNAALATKISFINEIANLAERLHVDVADVARAAGMDERIGPSYLGAGLGWGGSCLPKDLKALLWTADELTVSTPLLRAVLTVNEGQPATIISRLESLFDDLTGRTVAVWGLTFKPDCDDVRESPAVELVRLLLDQGTRVRACDPMGMPAASKLVPDVTYCDDPVAAARGSDAVVLATEWQRFTEADLDVLAMVVRQKVFVDARNVMDARELVDRGFVYIGVGRRTISPKPSGDAVDSNGNVRAADFDPPVEGETTRERVGG